MLLNDWMHNLKVVRIPAERLWRQPGLWSLDSLMERVEACFDSYGLSRQDVTLHVSLSRRFGVAICRDRTVQYAARS